MEHPTNSRGLPFHPTDTYVNWQEKDPVQKMKKLRAIYDHILLAGIPVKELEELLSDVYDSGRADEADNNNPDL
jgi:hypothetical protein